MIAIHSTGRARLAAILLTAILVPGIALAETCRVEEVAGTVILPPQEGPYCDGIYISPADLHLIIAGLPPGTTIEIRPIHFAFFLTAPPRPGGSLGGQIEEFTSNLRFQMTGTGLLEGFSRTITLGEVACETHTGPRNPGDCVQDFETDLFRLEGSLPGGDPDFGSLNVVAGNFFGLPSPGHMTLDQLPDGNFNVDSFFDVFYTIDFTGAPGGALDGLSGSTTATAPAHMQIGEARCRPDMNDDGVINLSDLGQFATAYFSAYECSADFNQDGIVNLTDLAAFANAFFSPYPDCSSFY